MASMTPRESRRDSDVVLSNFGHKEHLFKFLVIGDYGVGELRRDAQLKLTLFEI